MKEFINKQENINRIEFWAVTTIFVFIVFFHITDTVGNDWIPNRRYPDERQVPLQFYFFPKLIRFVFLYCTFLLLNFKVVPKLIQKKALLTNIIIVIIVFITAGIVFGITDTYLKSHLFDQYKTKNATYNYIFQNSFLYAFWLLLLFGFYSVIRYTGIYLLAHSEKIQSRYRMITPGALAAFILWMLSMFLLLVGNAPRPITAIWAIVIPFGILFYSYAFYALIPKALHKKKPFRSFIGKAILLLAITALPVALLALLLINDDEAPIVITFFNVAVQLFVTTPLSWVLFKRFKKGNEEIYVLKKELGQSNANFDFLRSQINPHFLFNALNTIYGTAIQEGAERTSEGIEKLGDMMRFMLQENMQEKIPLSREIEYLNNYIALQKLRTDPNPTVNIDAFIEQQVHTIQIAPMLLIPFVENAFKHGISFREPSHIKVTLEIKDNTLYFDVYNSKHVKSENDPEKGKSGIGLNNVKQRLQLLYPARHELIIRETGEEFFIHLTIQLT